MSERTVTQLTCNRKDCDVTAICIQNPPGGEEWPAGWAHCHVGKWTPPSTELILCPGCWTEFFGELLEIELPG